MTKFIVTWPMFLWISMDSAVFINFFSKFVIFSKVANI